MSTRHATRKVGSTRWTIFEDRIVRQSEGRYTVEHIQEILLQETGVDRTQDAIRCRMARLGVSRCLPGYTICGVARKMGVDFATAQRWVQSDLLGSHMYHYPAMITDDALEYFVRSQSHRYDRFRIRDAKLRSIADAVWFKDPWLTTDQIGMLLCHSASYAGRLMRSGEIPSTQAPQWGRWPGGVRWLAKRSDVIAYISTHLEKIGPYKPQSLAETL